MTLRDLATSLVRRWYFILVGLLITAVLCVVVVRTVPVAYDSEASVVLLPPISSTGKHGNPFLLLGGLSQAVDILTRTITADADSAPLLKANPGASFTIAADSTTTGPIILVTGTGKTAAQAKAMTASVVREVPIALERIQAKLSVERSSRIRADTIAVDASGTLNSKSRTQALAGVAAAGIILTVLLTGLIDGLLRARKRRRLRDTEEGAATSELADEAPTPPSVVTSPAVSPAAKPRTPRSTTPRSASSAARKTPAKSAASQPTASTSKDAPRESPGSAAE